MRTQGQTRRTALLSLHIVRQYQYVQDARYDTAPRFVDLSISSLEKGAFYTNFSTQRFPNLLVDPSLAFLLAQAYSKVYYKYLTTAAAYITIDTSEL